MARNSGVMPNILETFSALASMLRQLWRTSFGLPVEPEVGSSRARSEYRSGGVRPVRTRL